MTTSISQHHGGASIGALAGPEREVADYRRKKSLEALRTQPPLFDLSPTARVFRVPWKKGFKLVDEIKRRKTDKDGNEMEPQSDIRVVFKPCDVAPEHGEVVLDPAAKGKDDEPRAKADAERIRVLERFMATPHGAALGIFDFRAAQADAQVERDAELAAELAKPGALERIIKAGKARLGIAVEGGMADAIAAVAGGKKPEKQPEKQEKS